MTDVRSRAGAGILKGCWSRRFKLAIAIGNMAHASLPMSVAETDRGSPQWQNTRWFSTPFWPTTDETR
jgi:hypothetical protein